MKRRKTMKTPQTFHNDPLAKPAEKPAEKPVEKPAEPVVETPEAKAAAAKEAAAKAEADRIKARDDKSQASPETSESRAAAKDDKADKTPAKITVTFTGDPRGGSDPETPEYAGKVFPKGKAVVVDDVAWIKQYRGNLLKNNHFRVE